MDIKRAELKFGRENLIIETGKLAKQANGAVTVSYGGTVVLVTACISKEPLKDAGFFPLTVEYQEKTYAAGRIPGGFFKREGRPSENEILTARLMDRPIRPLFPKGINNEVQVMGLVLSSDGQNDPDVLSVVGASAALCISGIPFLGPVGACRVAQIDNQFVLNPTYEELSRSKLDVVVAATKSGIIMLESKCQEVLEATFAEALKFGFQETQKIIQLQEEFKRTAAKPQIELEYKEVDPSLMEKIRKMSGAELEKVCQIPQKEVREESLDVLCKKLQEQLIPKEPGQEGAPCAEDIKEALVEVERDYVRQYILKENKRIDGRGFNQIRPITCEVAVLPRTHGSSLFTRGQTQSLAVTTLGTASDEQMIEALEGETFKTFMLHYSFPPFSVGEVKPVRGPGRREIGHGALAERSLLSVMPSKEEFPYTVRVVSEILESNGSSSMATVCASALSLMDAGVPIKSPVAGVALGLIKEGQKYILLDDITGLEDHFGDMDFKVAGTKNGINVVQLDSKIEGLGLDILENALEEAKKSRLFILDKMLEVIKEPRKNISSFAPRIRLLKIKQEKIGELIGPGGKTIKKIISSTGANIDIDDDGLVMISAEKEESLAQAVEMVRALVEEAEVGKIYNGKIKKITDFGAFCEIMPGKEGLIHISELSREYVRKVEDVVKVGDEVRVKVISVDELGRINLSLKQVQAESE